MSTVPARHPKYRTKLCRNFISGKCAFGPTCSFIHPPVGMFPSYQTTSPFSRQLLTSWNALLPQIMASADQEGVQLTMQSPPQPQGSPLVDEDQSSSSLLLSTSDITNSELLSEARQHYNGRRKYPCRHFARTGGWCPAGDQCKFNHDLSTIHSSTVIREPKEGALPLHDVYNEEGRTISGGVLMGVTPLSQNTDQEYSFSSYTHTEEAKPYYSPPPWYWPGQPYSTYLPYYIPSYPVPVQAAVPVPPPPPAPAMQPNNYQPPTTTEVPAGLPTGAFEINGTTYFQPPAAPAPPPAFITHPIPAHPIPYRQMMHAPAPYYPPPPPPNYHTVNDFGVDPGAWYQPPFDPFASDPVIPEELPTSPLEPQVHHPAPIYPSATIFQSVSLSQRTPELDVSPPDAEMDRQTMTQEHEFPYRPPKNQRVGHARRISVTIKKHARVPSVG
ncbi:hypothetical protein HYDPIDRAFT_41040 [Hydnomerulius pinastri MD-312]|uniref:C3H1-type domain-containing protein n=1 Tax=Hydnomerulius pinastri MD-312 TaxID=994086 RepID=A0A0C9WE61_9AGAM|nr:hypothetical protein HYDPIDRAFT_41040 [Hydnomerulius pinastri MD-312]